MAISETSTSRWVSKEGLEGVLLVGGWGARDVEAEVDIAVAKSAESG